MWNWRYVVAYCLAAAFFAAFGWSWADSLSAMAIVHYGVKEGFAHWREGSAVNLMVIANEAVASTQRDA